MSAPTGDPVHEYHAGANAKHRQHEYGIPAYAAVSVPLLMVVFCRHIPPLFCFKYDFYYLIRQAYNYIPLECISNGM